jgi:PKD repeat protein
VAEIYLRGKPKVMRLVFILFITLLSRLQLTAQCPIADFTTVANSCIGQQLEFTNLTSGALTVEWDFCSGELASSPTATPVLTNNLLFRTRSFRVINQDGNWYGFAIDQASSPNRMVRFNFGGDLSNVPTVEDLGNPSGLLSGSFDFRMYKEGGNWYALVVNSGSNTLLRFSFGTNPGATPTVQDLGSFALLSSPNGINLIADSENLHAFITNGGSAASVVRLDFGNSILNAPAASVFAVTGATDLRGIAITRECDRWFGLITSYGNGKVFWLDFNNGINQAPVTGEITFFTGYNFPASLAIVNDGGEYFAFIQSALGIQYRLNFGSSIVDKTGSGSSLGNFGISNENFALEMVKNNSDWYAFTIDMTNRRLVRETFSNSCGASISAFTGINPPLVYYSVSGSNKITQNAYDSFGNVSYVTKNIIVSGSVAPDLAFTSQNVCVNNDVLFEGQNSSGDITSYNWIFGDGQTSNSSNPNHTFIASGAYDVALTATATNGCQNITRQQVNIYEIPHADFVIPNVSQICTNQNYTFLNASLFDSDSHPTWQWYVNSNPVSNLQDLEITFNDNANRQISLRASIPGCSTEHVVNLANIQTGPVVDFTVANSCELALLSFVNNTSNPVTSFSWTFGDGSNSSETNPSYSYSAFGNFDVTLSANNAAGCSNSLTKSLTIYSKPTANFSLALPPFSCSGAASQFTDLTPAPTDSNITSWNWTFDDTQNNTSTLKNPTHVYANAGDYNVNLRVATNFGCESEILKTVTIAQTPAVDFSNPALCLNQPATFTPSPTTEIKSWLWSMQNLTYSTQTPTHAFTATGNQTVTLAATGTNNCVRMVSKNLTVPVPVPINFSSTSTCAGKPAQFAETTLNLNDPAVGWSWDFAGQGTATTSSASHTFPSIGNYNVRLNSMRQSGCTYSTVRSIAIGQAPVAQFSVSAESGGVPLAVGFVNTSSNATEYLWKFDDASNTTSSDFSPSFVYTQLGTYQAELVASNNLGCTDSFVKDIFVVNPLVNAAVTNLLLLTNNDGMQATITFENRSNVVLVNPEIILDLGGNAKIKERVIGTFPPGQQGTKSITARIVSDNLAFICAEISVPDDINSFDNRACSNLSSELVVIPPYPNPANDEVIVEWIQGLKDEVDVKLINVQGQIVLNKAYTNLPTGLNQLLIKVDALLPGLYFATISDGEKTISHRILIHR